VKYQTETSTGFITDIMSNYGIKLVNTGILFNSPADAPSGFAIVWKGSLGWHHTVTSATGGFVHVDAGLFQQVLWRNSNGRNVRLILADKYESLPNSTIKISYNSENDVGAISFFPKGTTQPNFNRVSIYIQAQPWDAPTDNRILRSTEVSTLPVPHIASDVPGLEVAHDPKNFVCGRIYAQHAFDVLYEGVTKKGLTGSRLVKELQPLHTGHLLGDRLDDLMVSLNSESDDPSKVVQAGKPPATTSMVKEPQTSADVKKAELEKQMKAARSICSIAALYCKLQSLKAAEARGGHLYSISVPSEALLAFAEDADLRYNCAKYVVAGLLTLTDEQSGSMSKDITSGDLHLEFLTTIFKGLNFTKQDMALLDGWLTQTTQAASSIAFSSEDINQTMNHTVMAGTLDELDVDGTSLFSPTVTIIYMKVDMNSWRVSIGKASVRQVHFNMTTVQSTYAINMDLFTQVEPKINKVLKGLIGKEIDDYAKSFVKTLKPEGKKSQGIIADARVMADRV
jgi:hypothetical protein